MRVTRLILSMFIMLLAAAPARVNAQEVPGPDENIPFLMTFGKEGGVTSWGDDDFSQTFFFALPKDYKDPFYIRVYDPEIGGGVFDNGIDRGIYPQPRTVMTGLNVTF